MGKKLRIKKRGGKSGRRRVRSTGSDSPEPIELKMSELEAIIARSQTEPLSEQDCRHLRSVLQTLFFLTQELEKNRVSVQRLKQLLDQMRRQYSEFISEVNGEWVENLLTFSLKAHGPIPIKIDGTLKVDDHLASLSGTLPFAALPFRGKIEQSIVSELRRELS